MVTSLGFVLTNARRYDEAMAALNDAMAKGTDSTLAQLDLARVHRFAGRADLAVDLSRKMVESGDPLGEAFLAVSYAHAGRIADARAIVRKMESQTHKGQNAFLVAVVYAALGDRDPAFRWLEEGFAAHNTFLPWLKVDPDFEKLHGDPRFDDLIRRIGIPAQ